MEQGPTEAIIISQCLREGIPLPQRIEDAPSLLLGLELYYIAFMDLMSSRNSGFGMGAVSWDTVQRYCDTYKIVGEQAQDMHFHIKEMDTAFMKHHSKK